MSKLVAKPKVYKVENITIMCDETNGIRMFDAVGGFNKWLKK
jgi:hypothetical protein